MTTREVGTPAKRSDRATEGFIRRMSSRLSRVGTRAGVSDADRAGFLAAQRLAQAVAVEVAGTLTAGVTEREAARRLGDALRARGVTQFLHTPFAWFGEHSRFDPSPGDYDRYHPTDRTLGGDEPFILDISPVVDGWCADIGYSASLAPNPKLDAAKVVLRALRERIPAWFVDAAHPGEVWETVAAHVRDAGYVPTHADYPFRVLGHRLFRLGAAERRLFHWTKLPGGPMGSSWFSPQAAMRFASRGIASQLITPDHRGDKRGIWAIEPHIGGDGFGAKFEEILVVGDGEAAWLDASPL
jgi:hypothetical protein